MKQFFYVPLEVLKARYTAQLGSEWIPAAFNAVNGVQGDIYRFSSVDAPAVSDEIRSGSVLDGVNRGKVSLMQMHSLLHYIEAGLLHDDDVIYLQDFWTPGLEAVMYALHQQNIKLRIYAMCHAQSVDEYDFTYPMRSWMRPVEIAYSHMLAGLFVASTVHRDQLRAAGYVCPIHVVGLPIHAESVISMMPQDVEREKQIIFSSRLNNEKNPYFMLEVAAKFLAANEDWTWAVTTSASGFTSEVPGLTSALFALAGKEPRFKLLPGLTKEQYYSELRSSRIQFNCSLQDYVSWTLLEALSAGCEPCYPDFRSFTECVPACYRYTAFQTNAAADCLQRIADSDEADDLYGLAAMSALYRCDRGLLVEMAIMLNNWQGPEVNVWHQPDSYFRGVGLL